MKYPIIRYILSGLLLLKLPHLQGYRTACTVFLLILCSTLHQKTPVSAASVPRQDLISWHRTISDSIESITADQAPLNKHLKQGQTSLITAYGPKSAVIITKTGRTSTIYKTVNSPRRAARAQTSLSLAHTAFGRFHCRSGAITE